MGFSIFSHKESGISDRTPGRVIDRRNAFPPALLSPKISAIPFLEISRRASRNRYASTVISPMVSGPRWLAVGSGGHSRVTAEYTAAQNFKLRHYHRLGNTVSWLEHAAERLDSIG